MIELRNCYVVPTGEIWSNVVTEPIAFIVSKNMHDIKT